MCGIVGYVGSQNAPSIILGGIKRLEYRGYDSAGLAVVQLDGTIGVRRAVGKLVKLEELVAAEPVSGRAGIGHTRWATPGEPRPRKAPPPCGGQGAGAV